MSAEIGISIGGIEFHLAARDHRLRRSESEPYRAFVWEPARPSGPEVVQVVLEVSPRPTFAGEEIFQSEATWSLLAHEEERAFVFREPASADALYVARFRPGSREVSILCSPRMAGIDEGGPFLDSPFRYPLDQILTMYFLAGRGFVVHSAGLSFRGRGLVFPGISGAGKSTFARLAGDRPGWEPLSDDRTVVRLDEDGPLVFGSPWPGEGRIAANARAPLAGVLFLEKGPANAFRPIRPAECLSRLFPVVTLPWFDPGVLPAALEACESIAETVPSAVLTFRPEPGAAEAVEDFITRD